MITNNTILLGTVIAVGSNSALTTMEKPLIAKKHMAQVQPTAIVEKVKEPKNLLATKSFKDLCDEIDKQAKAAEEAERKRIAEEKRIESLKKDNRRMDAVGINSNNLTVKSNITVDEFNKVFDKIGQPQMKQLSQAFVDAEQTYSVNALFLAGIVAQESGWMHKPAGDGTNLTGYAVYTKDANGKVFHSYYGNIMETAKLLSHDYLNPKGRYFNGTSMVGVNTLYCKYQDQVTTDYRWSQSIYHISNNFEDVYQNKVKKHHEI